MTQLKCHILSPEINADLGFVNFWSCFLIFSPPIKHGGIFQMRVLVPNSTYIFISHPAPYASLNFSILA